MQAFADLYEALDATHSTRAKVSAMAAYFASQGPADAAWGLFFLIGARFKRLIAPSRLWVWAVEATGIPPWLFEDAQAAVGDLSETIALLLPEEPSSRKPSLPLSIWVEERLLPLRDRPEAEQREAVLRWWRSATPREVYLINKMLTGGLRVGVSRTLTVRALAEVAGVDPVVITERLMGEWQPSAAWFQALLSQEANEIVHARPYPFCLASPLDGDPAELGPPEDWLVEWKWDGIRGQLIRRGPHPQLWSRGEELITERFPEIIAAAQSLPVGTVLDGEVLAWKDGRVQPFALLQKRIGRKQLSRRILEDAPAAILAYDLLECDGVDLRAQPLHERRRMLEALLAGAAEPFAISPRIEAGSWEALAEARAGSREQNVEGLMLKRLSSPYGAGRRKGDWWKWKIDPLTMDAVMIYAQAGNGRRAALYTDYTFALWKDGELVPVAKAYSGLSDEEILALDNWIRRHTLERFGPVRAVEPVQVFELAFEAIQRSTRHKSGIAVRFPRILRWRQDKPAEEADTLENVMKLIRD